MNRISKYITAVVVIWLLSSPVSSQQKTIDSLEVLISKGDISMEEKILYMVSLGVYYNTIDEQKAMMYAKRSVELARKQDDNKYGIYAYAGLAVNYADRDSILECYIAMDSCQWYIRKSTDAKAIAHGLNSLTIIKTMLGDKDDIPNMLLEGIELIKDKREWELDTKIYYSLYEYYLSSNLNYAKEYLDLAGKASDQANKAALSMECSNGISIYYLTAFRKDTTQSLLLDSALHASTSSLDLYNLKAGYIPNHFYMTMLQERAEIYLEKKQLDSAGYYADKLIDTAINLDEDYLSSAYNILCDIELSKNNIDTAKEYLFKSFELLNENSSFTTQYELNMKMANIYTKEKKFEEALKYTQKALEIFSKENTEKYIREGLIAHAKYSLKEKELELEKANKKNLFYLFCIILFVIITLIFILLLRNNQLKLKNSKQQTLLLDKEKKDAELQAILEKERAWRLNTEKEKIRLRLEAEKNRVRLSILETSQLRKELMIGNAQLQHKNEALKSIKQKLRTENTSNNKEIKRLLENEKRIDEHIEEFSELLKVAHPDFFSKLQDKAQQKLTLLDLRYCIYTFMNLSSKDIASILSVEPKTVRMVKYRLKQKLNLTKEEDLNSFIQNVVNSII